MGPLAPAEADEMARAVARLLPPALVPIFGGSFIRSCHLYDEFVYRLTLRVFCASGLEAAAREPGTPAEIVARAALEPRCALVPVDWMLRRLAERGIVEVIDHEPRRFRLRESVPQLDPAPLRDEQRRHGSSWLPSYVLAELAAGGYPAFLGGRRAGEEVLFSPANLRLWMDFFSNDNGLYAVNNLVGAIAVEEWMPPGPVTIVELGGGLGSAAAALLERLRAAPRWTDIAEYRFTELVPAFLRRGQQALKTKFPGASFLTFAALDMNRPFEKQGVAPGSVSIVYAVNTLHVAHDLDVTLREVLAALAPGGRLIISECARPAPGQPIYVEFIFNLMETFRNGGFLTPQQWRDALEAAGFVDVRVMPDLARIRRHFPAFYVGAIGATRPA